MNSTIGDELSRIPRFRAAAGPRHSCRNSVILMCPVFAFSREADRSLALPSSHTITSKHSRGRSWVLRASRQRSKSSTRSRTGTTTLAMHPLFCNGCLTRNRKQDFRLYPLMRFVQGLRSYMLPDVRPLPVPDADLQHYRCKGAQFKKEMAGRTLNSGFDIHCQ